MARPKQPPRGDKFLMLARMRVPLDRPLPAERDGTAVTTEDTHWDNFLATLENARGCGHVACSRVAEDPEKVLFVITWRDQSCLDEFRASPDYAVLLMGLGILDLASESSSSSSSSLPSIQIIKFQSPSATSGLYLRGWLSWYTVALPVDDPGEGVDAGRDQLLRRLVGPRYPTSEERGGRAYDEWWIRLVNLPLAARRYGLHRGWVQETRTMEIARKGGDDVEEGKHAVEVKVQDGVIYKMWESREAEEELKAAIPEVDMNEYWERDLREGGAVGSWEEHVMLVRVTYGQNYY